MFTSKERQKQRTGRYGSSREDYLQELVTEFQKTTNEDSKCNIVAHLANFAYDPFNYEFFRKLNVIELFLDCLTEPCTKMVEYGMAGICNCCPDPANAAIIVENNGIRSIISCIFHTNRKIALYAVTALYFLCTPLTRAEIIIPSLIEQMKYFTENGSTDIQLKNTANAFLDKHLRT
ncbi:hypothetical protein KP509_39G005400 [Ceratopteris richardii]|uniref:Armadillo repeat-containing protein 7 n=1 Tax=Ceratopteris richardii TaxID=49495 RepID=A0A8T2PYB5_CERRI|nr:hypothetical protein KP509_39G005400 [Ceratopteris richardii]KAH7276399.1 hypothetical protein KP509_39G005400 [Ceratopteris richardii]